MPTPLSPDQDQSHIDYKKSLTSHLGPNYAQIPEHFKWGDPKNLIPKELSSPDRLCGLPTMEDKTRDFLLNKTISCIKKGGKVVVLEIDADQLKTANTRVSRQFGDEIIQYGAAVGTKLIDEASLSCESVAVRSGSSPDETLFFFFNPSDEEMAKIKGIRRKANETHKVTVTNRDNNPTDFTIGTSCGIATSSDQHFAHELEDTINRLKTGQLSTKINFFRELIDYADAATKGIKTLHELAEIPVEQTLGMSLHEFEDFATDKFGGTRISKAGLRVLLRINSILSHRASGAPSPGIQEDLVSLEQELDEPRATNYLRKVVEAYNAIYPRPQKPPSSS